MKISALEDIIIDKIENEGPVSFSEFMDMSLYYPGLGYYTSGNDKIGKNGDYYTSPWLSTVFGEMIAIQLAEMCAICAEEEFTVVEFGGGNGRLCTDILRQLSKTPEVFRKIKYCIVEKKGRIPDDKKIQVPGTLVWYESINEIPPVQCGCILSNELIDNFPVSVVVMQDELMEVFVDYNDGFKETLQPAKQELKDYLQQSGIALPKGFRTEINLAAIKWIGQVATLLQKGFVMTIDYGYLAGEYYRPDRKQGTLVCYHRHQVNFQPYKHIGEQDITSHVNFSALQHWGQLNSLDFCGYTNQANFLQGLGLAEHLKKSDAVLEKDPAVNAKKAIMLHTFLADMGRKFKVLVQSKGLNQSHLSGLRFGQPMF